MDVAPIIASLGGDLKAAERFKLKRTAVAMWKKRNLIPVKHCWVVFDATGIPPHQLRPEAFRAPELAAAPQAEAA